MLLSDLGAEVLRLDRASDAPNGATVGGASFVSPVASREISSVMR